VVWRAYLGAAEGPEVEAPVPLTLHWRAAPPLRLHVVLGGAAGLVFYHVADVTVGKQLQGYCKAGCGRAGQGTCVDIVNS
jgi:hypothetical protein